MTQTHRDPCPHPDCREQEPNDGSVVSRSQPRRQRTVDELRDALQRLIDVVSHRRQPGAHAIMTIPVDEEHDADVILADGITELVWLREMLEDANWGRQVFIEHVAQHTDHTCCFRQELEQRRTQ